MIALSSRRQCRTNAMVPQCYDQITSLLLLNKNNNKLLISLKVLEKNNNNNKSNLSHLKPNLPTDKYIYIYILIIIQNVTQYTNFYQSRKCIRLKANTILTTLSYIMLVGHDIFVINQMFSFEFLNSRRSFLKLICLFY